MSVLSSTYYEELPDLDRYGNPEEPSMKVTVHIAGTFYEHVHISLETEERYAEVNLTIENAEAILIGLRAAIDSAIKGRNLGK